MSKIIAVDDGHGTNTSGKRTPAGYKENEFNHYTKEFLIDELKRNNFKIVDCSPSRSDNSLEDRVKRERNGKADIFISIHFNAMGSKWQDKASGIETYYHGVGGVKGNGYKLAKLVHAELLKGTKLKDRGVKSDGVLYNNGLYVLRETKSPAILVECGFMDNKKEAELMKSTSYRKECSQEIAKGICKYFGVAYKEKKKEEKKEIKYIVQAGAFTSKDEADKLIKELKAKGFDALVKKV